MTREFSSLGAMAMGFAEMAVAEVVALDAGLGRVLAKIEKTAKDEIGHYQEAVGQFGAWPELADSTKEDRVHKGFTENDPLYRSGELQASIGKEQHGLEGAVGSTSPVMVYMEFGTSKAPARAVIGPAAVRNEHEIKRLVGAAAVAGLVGGESIHAALGYEFSTEG